MRKKAWRRAGGRGVFPSPDTPPPIASLQEATFCLRFAGSVCVIVAVLLSATERFLLFFSPGCVM